DRPRHCTEGEWCRESEGGRADPGCRPMVGRGQTVFITAGRSERLSRKIWALSRTEQTGVISLCHIQREPALEVHDRGNGPTADDPVGDFVRVHPSPVLAEGKLDDGSKDHPMLHIESAVAVLSTGIVTGALELLTCRAPRH